MNTRCVLVTMLLTCMAPGYGVAGAEEFALRAAVDHAVEQIKPALVRIHVISTSYREGREIKFQSSGSGVIITPEGHVITNHHVAGKATRLVCTLWNREEVEATLIGTDPLSDIAVIQLAKRDGTPYTPARFGDSSLVRVGDDVMAMGSPLALSQSVTLGIISNTQMIMPKRMGYGRFRLDGEDIGSLVRWFGHDAQIFGGNSGGPLVNLDGEIIGINEISFGLGGAIPGNLARRVAESLIENGTVTRSWIGLNVQPLLKHGDQRSGILVTGTIEGSPAAKAGIQSGDTLLSVNGREFNVRFDEQLPEFNGFVNDLTVGEEVVLIFLRDGNKQAISLHSEEREPRRPRQREFRKWGITARNLSKIMAKELKRDSPDGVLVTSVRPGGPAGEAKPGIKRNDVIVAVGGTPVRNLDDLREVTKALSNSQEDGPTPVLTAFERKTGSYLTVVKVGIRELKDPGLEVKKAWLPVQTQVITRDIAKALGDPELTGFRVTRVYDDEGEEGDAARLQSGDLIVAVDGEKLLASAPEHYEELNALIRSYRTGTVLEIDVIRDGTAFSISETLGRSPKLDREMKKYRDDNFEFTVRDVTFFDRADERWDADREGVLVDEVKSGSWGALGLLRTGDLILQVDGRSIPDVGAMEEAMGAVAEAQAEAVLLKILRGIYTIYIELEPKWD
ncbi:MAG: PDZ domain-containing protein [Candidatus Hydrogenedentes bacterium]|nr:PDZ domain-containing protein [Candidatus Hydrogenedentota bacterium]